MSYPEPPNRVDGPYGSGEPCIWVQETETCLGMWLITSTLFHPFWNQWAISTVHLREVAGLPPANKEFPEATHELIVVALNPEHGPYQPIASTLQFLRPTNIQSQFVGTDEQAANLPWLTARAVVNGILNPEPEGIIGARQRWDSAIAATLDHDRDPHHGQLN